MAAPRPDPFRAGRFLFSSSMENAHEQHPAHPRAIPRQRRFPRHADVRRDAGRHLRRDPAERAARRRDARAGLGLRLRRPSRRDGRRRRRRHPRSGRAALVRRERLGQRTRAPRGRRRHGHAEPRPARLHRFLTATDRRWRARSWLAGRTRARAFPGRGRGRGIHGRRRALPARNGGRVRGDRGRERRDHPPCVGGRRPALPAARALR